MRILFLILAILPFVVSAHGDTTIVHNSKGDAIEIYTPQPDTLPFINQHTLRQETRISQRAAVPITLNGQDILFYTKPHFIITAAKEKINDAVLKIFNDIKDSLVLGSYSYHLPDIVIGPEGKVAYYSHDAFSAYPATDNGHVKNGRITPEQKQAFEKKFDTILAEIEFIPLVIDGEKVPFRLDISFDFRVNS